MKPWRRSSGEEYRIDNIDEHIMKIVELVAGNLRRAGVRISSAELVMFSKLLAIYSELKGGELSRDDISFVACSVLCKRSGDNNNRLKELLSSGNGDTGLRDIIKGIRLDLAKLGATPGASIRLSRGISEESQAAYARLRLLGVIRGSPSRGYVVSEKDIYRIARRLTRSASSYQEAVSKAIMYSARSDSTLLLAARLGSELPRYVDLRRLSVRELLKLYRYTRSRPLRRYIATILRDAASSHSSFSSDEARMLLEILSKEKMLNQEVLKNIVSANPRLVDNLRKSLTREELLDIALASNEKDSSIELAAEALQIPRSYKKAADFILADRVLLEKTRRGEVSEDALRVLAKIAEARDMLVRSIREAQGLAYYDYALAELEKAGELVDSLLDSGEVGRAVKRIYEKVRAEAAMLSSGKSYAVLKSLVKELPLIDAIKLLNTIAHSPNDRIRAQARRLLYLVSRRYVSISAKGRRSRRALGSGYGRIAVRQTIINIARLKPSPLSIIRYKRTKNIILVVDKSGSMRDFAVAALLSAAALTPLVKKIIFFDENIYIVNNLSHSNIHRLVEMVLSTQFSGYTNIIGALNTVARSGKPSKLIIISDLRQTVKPFSSKDVCNAFKRLRDGGWNVVVLTPLDTYPECLKSIGVRVNVVRSVDDLRRILLRL